MLCGYIFVQWFLYLNVLTSLVAVAPVPHSLLLLFSRDVFPAQTELVRLNLPALAGQRFHTILLCDIKEESLTF